MFIFLIFILGISIGSFLNVLIDRLPRGESVLKGRSYCESCKKDLAWHDLIPLFSFIQLKGKCRYCQFPIGWYYPIVELTTGMFFVSVYFKNFQFSILNSQLNSQFSMTSVLTIPYYLFIIAAFIVIFFTDLKYGIIPDKIIYPSILVSAVYVFIIHNSLFVNHLLSAISAFLFFYLLMIGTEIVLKKSGMGFGDVKLVFLLGLFLGFPQIIISLYLSFLTGALVSIILVILKKKKFFGGTIPFGPFLILGSLITLSCGDFIINNILIYIFRF